MVKIHIESTPGLGFQKIIDLIEDFGTPETVDTSSKKVVLDFGGGDSIKFGGSGFKAANDIPYKGTVKSLDVKIDGAKLVHVEGVKLDVPKVAEAIKDGDFEELVQLVNRQLSGRDYISGGSGDDTIYSFGGDDKLYGRAGNDTLFGGSGKDTFVFTTKLDSVNNVDKVRDFVSKTDKFELGGAFKDLADGKLAKSAFKVITDVAAPTNVDASDRILYDKKHGDIYFDRDGSHDKYGMVKFAELKDGAALAHGDFLII